MHPGFTLGTSIKQQGRTQKQFAFLVGKKVSEINELIKGKRNITIQRDYLLHTVLGTPLKYWINLQRDYDYDLFLASLSTEQPAEHTQQPAEQSEEQHSNQGRSPDTTEQGAPPLDSITDVSISEPENNSINTTDDRSLDSTIDDKQEQLLQEKQQIFKDF